MAWYHQILGKASGNVAEVDSDNQLLISSNQDPEKAGAFRLYDANGDAVIVEENGALSVSQDELVFSEQVDGNNLNINRWATSVSGMTITQASGFINLNAGAATTANAYAILSSIMSAPLYGDMPLEFAFNAKVTVQPQSNFTIELGLGTAATNVAPTDGAFFRWTSTGAFQAVVNNGGSETALTCSVPSGETLVLPPISNDTSLFIIVISEDHVQFFINDILVADIDNPPSLSFPTSAGHQTLLARVYNGGSSPSQAPILQIGQAIIRQLGVNLGRSFRDVICSIGLGAYQLPVNTFIQTANHANSSSPASAALSNTAAGYTTLGGRFQFAAVAGAATDYALFAFQVPSPYKLYITGVCISCVNIGAAVTTTATVLDWSLGVNASAVSLATAENPPTSWAPRRIPLGVQAFQLLDAIGKVANDINRIFDPPVIVDAGRYSHIIIQIPVGSATGSEILRGDIVINGYFE